MTGVAKGTILKLLADVGDACARYHAENVRGLTCVQVQCDEIWSYVAAKERNIKPADKSQSNGDIWTWVGIDAETKLVINYVTGQRNTRFARRFADDLASRIKSHVQISTDGLGVYAQAIPWAFGNRADLGQEIKEYGSNYGPSKPDTRYSPQVVNR
jgi:IS1 family transposase